MLATPFTNVIRFDGVAVPVSPNAHECELTSSLEDLPVEINSYGRRVLHEAVEAALYCDSRPPQSRDLILNDCDGRRWLVFVEPMTDLVAYSAWELVE